MKTDTGPLREGEAGELGSKLLLHAEVYRELRRRLATGKIVPGVGLSTRGLAQELGVSQMPVREALSRLSADGAIEIRSRRKIVIAPMTPARFDDVLRCRLLLEPEAAKLALPSLDEARRDALRAADARLDAALESCDVNAYMEANYDFHFGIYQAHPAQTLNRLIEMLWLQFGPYMRLVYERYGTGKVSNQHHTAIAAIERGDAEGLTRAIRRDIEEGMGLIGRNGLTETS
jgi:DNA-binding GntR family transcriptional regulator